MPSITATARAFFVACEAGKGWEACAAYCTPDAGFSAQAEPLANVSTLQGYADWMKGMMTVLTDGHYELRSFATDAERNNVSAYAVFVGTHPPGGRCRPPERPRGRTTCMSCSSRAIASAT
jgi:hypothetical protein